MNLYELTAQAKEVLSMEDIDKQTIEDTLEGMGLDDKFASYSAILKTWKADSEALSNAIKQLQDKKATNENKIARLKDMALYSMKELDITNLSNQGFPILGFVIQTKSLKTQMLLIVKQRPGLLKI